MLRFLIGPAVAMKGANKPSQPASTTQDRLSLAIAERDALIVVCETSLALLDEQRVAVADRSLPRLRELWHRLEDADDAAEVFADRREIAGVTPDDIDAVASSRSELAGSAGPELLGELSEAYAAIARLRSVRASATQGTAALARFRVRLGSSCRRLEELAARTPSVAEWTQSQRRMLLTTASIGGAADALAALPVVARDGGIDRRFSAALRQM